MITIVKQETYLRERIIKGFRQIVVWEKGNEHDQSHTPCDVQGAVLVQGFVCTKQYDRGIR